MSQALYRKYRSKSFEEIVGQKGTVTALQNAIATKTIGHAYLFTGPRGVGKTSIARIFAFAINNIPYSAELPVDIIEIDAASNRGIEEARDLRDKVRIAPVVGPYKIYIIDEVHMLTSHSFNALLKTLEEPPAHVIFILATTESHKLPETILSRTQRYNFKLASKKEVVNHLSKICNKENIIIEPSALEIIAKHSGGSLRDALSLLDHSRHLGTNITAADVRANIGVPDDEITQAILTALQHNDASELLNALDDAISCSSALQIAKELSEFITENIRRNTLHLSLNRTTKLLHQLAEVDNSSQQEIKLRIALLSCLDSTKELAAPTTHTPPTETLVKPKTNPTVKSKDKSPIKPNADSNIKLEETAAEKIETVPKSKALSSDETTKSLTANSWAELLEDIRATHNTLYSVLRMAQVNFDEVENHKITFYFQFPFHQKRINDMKNKDIISNKLANNGFGHYEIICEVADKPEATLTKDVDVQQKPDDKEDVLHQIRGVFGAAEVLE